MLLLLLLLLPFATALISFASGNGAKMVALGGSALTLAIAAYATATAGYGTAPLQFNLAWMPDLGANFSLLGDSMALMLCLLTAIVQLVIMIHQQNKPVAHPSSYYGLLMLAQVGLMGVFLAGDGLLFYFFWELALIPVYFLCSKWGGERRIPITFKFFVYTFLGSLMLLAGIIYIYLQTPGEHSYSYEAMMTAGRSLPVADQQWLFWLFFGAFAIKMPIFPFHTWQPDTYQTSPTPVTIILSALMVKMGLYGVLRWLLPVLPDGAAFWSETVVIFSIVGIVYASCIALVQTDLKRLVAYSSIAHMGLMAAVAFSHPAGSTFNEAILVQMFIHGINITGMWLIVHMVETRYGTTNMKELGGAATRLPQIAIALVIIGFANIGLPLTSGFIGEFMLFHGLFQSPSSYHVIYMTVAGLAIILGAAYTLKMVRAVAYGPAVETTGLIKKDLTANEWIGLSIIIALILFLGIYPKPLLALVAM